MEILNAAARCLDEVSRIPGLMEKAALKGRGLRQGDYTFIGTR